jgi:predicted tellurium resistance membrane protein TerC
VELALVPAAAAAVVAGLGVELRLFAPSREPRRGEAIAWSIGANAFALLGLSSLLALVGILPRRLRYVDETIALILAFVGIKILTAELVHISDLASLAVIAGLLGAGIVASLIGDRLSPPHPVEEATRGPPRCPERLTPPSTPRR